MNENTLQPSRVLALQGGINFRDLGGYPSRNGKTVVWRNLLRSGHMSNLTETDKQHLAELQLAQIHDFCNHREQQQFPNPIKEVSPYRNYQMTFGSIGKFMELAISGEITEAKSRFMLEETYTAAVDGLRGELGRFVKTIAAGGNGAIVFHCMAGKDRTGLAAAVLLMALDVPESTIIDDYLLTLRYFDVDWMLEMLFNDLQSQGIKGHKSAYRPFCTVSESCIVGFLQKVKQSYQNYTDYLQRGLGLTPSEIYRLQQIYLED